MADGLVFHSRVNLTGLIEEFCDPWDFEDLTRQKIREKILIFCLIAGCLFLEEDSG